MLGISRQAFYQSQTRNEKRVKVLSQIKPLVLLSIRRDMPRIGTPKLYFLLKQGFVQLNIKIGRDTLFNYLRSEQLLVKPKRSYTKTTYSKHWLRKHPNLLKELKPERPEHVFVSDIIYIKSREGTHYLSLVTDTYSGKIMGYKLSDDMIAENVVKVFKMAVKYKKTNQRHNTSFRSWFAILFFHLSTSIKESIDTYNNKRPHLSLNMKTPNFIHNKKPEQLTALV